MTALRVINVIVWGFMMAYMLPAAWSAVFGTDMRRGDPMRLACMATAFVIVGFNLRTLLAHDSLWTLQALYVLSIAAGVHILLLARAYGRGPRV